MQQRQPEGEGPRPAPLLLVTPSYTIAVRDAGALGAQAGNVNGYYRPATSLRVGWGLRASGA